jgi:hypothetical protein
MLSSVLRHGARVCRPTAARSVAQLRDPTSELNWSLNKDGVTPSGEAFRNAPPAAGKGDGKKGAVPAETSLDHVLYEGVTAALGKASTLWVQDGEVGTARGATVGIRLVTDDAALAAAAPDLMLRVSDKGAHAHARPLLVLASTSTCGEPAPFAGLDVDVENGSAVVLMGGSASVPALQKAIAGAAGGVLGSEKALKYKKPTNGFDILA